MKSFEELNIYKKARDLTKKIYNITRNDKFSEDKALVDQIRRACVSIMSNIAEGFERGTNVEFIQFLYIAKGSCGEVRAQLDIAFDQGYINSETYNALKSQCRQISGMIGNLIKYMKGSRLKGPKFVKPKRKSIKEELEEILKGIKSQSDPET